MQTPNAEEYLAGEVIATSTNNLRGDYYMRLIPLALVCAVIASPAIAAGNAADGQRDFGRCAVCHATQQGHNGIGPSLAAVGGRQSGTEAGYNYSPAMTGARITWNDATLDRFLANPQAVVHGTKMFVAIPDAHQRQDIIAYLETLK